MSYINTLYGAQSSYQAKDIKPQANTAGTATSSAFLDMLKQSSPAQGWPTEKKESPDQIFENQTNSIKDAYKNNSISKMLENAKSVYDQLKINVASQEMQIKPTPTLTSILSKI